MDVITKQQALVLGERYYFTGKPCKYGHTARRSVADNNCAECARLRSKANRDKDPQKARKDCVETELRLKETNYELWQQKRKQWRQAVKAKHGPIKYMLAIIRDRAKQKGLEFTITREDVTIPSHCPMLGIPLFNTTGKKTDNTPSIDRIDKTKGYIPGNVHVISERANRLKNNGTAEELQQIADYLRRHQ